MDIRAIKSSSAEALAAAPGDPYRLTLLHTGVSLLATLVLTLINWFLSSRIGATGGLAGMGTRAILTTARAVLAIGFSVALPFWNLGFTRASLSFARREKADTDMLLEGFRRFGPAVRLMLLQTGITIAVVLASVQLGSFLFLATPQGLQYVRTAMTLVESGAVIDEAAIASLVDSMGSLYVIAGVLALALGTPIFYRLRLTSLCLMGGCRGAFAAVRLSSNLTRGRRFRFFRLDLSFWWYYALQLAAVALSYGDYLLETLHAPVNADAAFWVCYLVSIAAQLLITWRFAPQVHTTFATAFDSLINPDKAQKSGNT